jgi:hypothetical protein
MNSKNNNDDATLVAAQELRKTTLRHTTQRMMIMTARIWRMMTTRPDHMDEDHAVTLFEFVGWELTPSAHEHASNLSIQRHDDGRRRRDLTYKTDLLQARGVGGMPRAHGGTQEMLAATQGMT